MESAIAVAQAGFLPWVGGVGGGREGGEESRREQGPRRAELAWLTPSPLLPWSTPPPTHLTRIPSSPSAFCLGLLSWKLRVQESPPRTPATTSPCQSSNSTVLVRGVPVTTGYPIPPPPSQKVRCAPLRNWGSESETAFSLSHLSRSHRNKRRYTTHYLSKFLPSSPGHNWGFSKEREF